MQIRNLNIRNVNIKEINKNAIKMHSRFFFVFLAALAFKYQQYPFFTD